MDKNEPIGINQRSGMKLMFKLPEDESFVSMVEFKGKIIVCSTRGIYEIKDGKVRPIPLEFKPNKETTLVVESHSE